MEMCICLMFSIYDFELHLFLYFRFSVGLLCRRLALVTMNCGLWGHYCHPLAAGAVASAQDCPPVSFNPTPPIRRGASS